MKFLSGRETSKITLPCSSSLVYEILTDYDHYLEWLTFITDSKMMAKEGDLAIAEFKFGTSSRRIVVECIQAENQLTYLRKISGEARIDEMYWEIRSLGDEECEISLRVDWVRNIRAFLQRRPWFWDSEKLLAALKGRVEILSSTFPIADATGHKVIELMETEKGLLLWIYGKQYLLSPLPENHD